MKLGTFLRQVTELPVRGLDAFGSGGLVVVAPHPDDESIGCGGTLARCTAEGRPVAIIVVSDGSASHPASRSHPRTRLRRLRETETLAAVEQLGVPPRAVHFLALPDQFVPSAGPEASRAGRAVADIADGIGASAICAAWHHDPHRDHQASFAIVELAMRMRPGRLLAYPVWGWTLPRSTELDKGPLAGFRIDIGPYQAAKHAAIAAHHSQHGRIIVDDPDAFRLEADLLVHVERPHEVFLEISA
ncbi:PIG-L deacetylase family protein [Chelatococcus reniformis]|uniref:PIG-L family deacetylase n=1 Tax=Chelatococcus reniformis TaxID=1494448 RepID=A0A916UBN1_9HYPH|nr:PIG-L family deacetylase [Chelatococcus reniformis]GGC66640.1 hypothetical protein GCM10010994_26530 [Chelatococcus reniformis]